MNLPSHYLNYLLSSSRKKKVYKRENYFFFLCATIQRHDVWCYSLFYWPSPYFQVDILYYDIWKIIEVEGKEGYIDLLYIIKSLLMAYTIVITMSCVFMWELTFDTPKAKAKYINNICSFRFGYL